MRHAKLGVVLPLSIALLQGPRSRWPTIGWRWLSATARNAQVGRLPNRGEGYVDVAAPLRRLGFQVTPEPDTNRRR